MPLSLILIVRLEDGADVEEEHAKICSGVDFTALRKSFNAAGVNYTTVSVAIAEVESETGDTGSLIADEADEVVAFITKKKRDLN